MDSHSGAVQPRPDPLFHRRSDFSFTVNAAFEQAAPLFGAWEERKWAPGWNPEFVYPLPPQDQQGSVFVLRHEAGQGQSIWTTSAFDLRAGHVQYVYVRNTQLVTLIDIRLAPVAADETFVSVMYQRTALTPDANGLVEQLAKQDEGFASEWERQINGYLARSRVR